MNIVLTGFMACGKTTTAKALKDKLSMDIIDTDEEIVKREGRSINDIFSQEGEGYFRKLETGIIKEMADNLDNFIISTGGGLPITEGNGELLKKLGKVVYLTVTQETVLKRIEGDSSRPLLKDDAKENTRKLLEYRSPIYQKNADITVSTDDRTTEEIVNEIISKI